MAVPIRDAFRYQLRVASIQTESHDAVSVYVTGRHLERMQAEAGQFFRWRFLDRTSWWEAHPFSLSAAPNAQFLRITAKGVGDHSRALRHVRPGTRVMAEGPYGNLTARRRTRPRVRAHRRRGRDHPAAGAGRVAARRAGGHHLAVPGQRRARPAVPRRARRAGPDPGHRGPLPARPPGQDDRARSAPDHLRQHVPDIAERDIYLCGPPGMMDAGGAEPASRSGCRRAPDPPANGSSCDEEVLMRRAAAAIGVTVIGMWLVLSFKSSPASRITAAANAPAPTTTEPRSVANGGGQPPAGPPPGPGSATTDDLAAGGRGRGRSTGPSCRPATATCRSRSCSTATQIVDVKALQLPFDRARSQDISTQVAPLLHDEVVQAQSAQIDTIGGATYTSDAYAQSLQSALDKAHA